MSSNRHETGGHHNGSPERYCTDWTRAPSVSMAVIEAVAEAADVDPIELGPLTDTVDPDALNTLFDSIDHERTETVRELTLRFEGRQVTVHSTGELFVQPLGPAARF